MDEGRKRVLLIAAAILAARKLSQYDGGKKVPQRSPLFRMLCAGRNRSCMRSMNAGQRIIKPENLAELHRESFKKEDRP
jgi:hypothetical protein